MLIEYVYRRDSFITHRAFCDALAQESARSSQPLPPPGGDFKVQLVSPPPPPPPPPAAAASSPPPPPLTPSTGVLSPVLSIQSSGKSVRIMHFIIVVILDLTNLFNAKIKRGFHVQLVYILYFVFPIINHVICLF